MQPFITTEALSSSPGPGMRTPPYTPQGPYHPHRRSKRPLSRADSPASSIHPTETVSPAKKAQKRQQSTALEDEDDIRVEELVEGDPGYYTDVELIYPLELEEADSPSPTSSTSYLDDEEALPLPDDPESTLNRRLSRLHCADEEAEFERERERRRQIRRKAGSRTFKRSHSQSMKSEAEESDVDADAMDDHDLSGSQRRLRRRVRGPEEEGPEEEVSWSSPDTGNSGRSAREVSSASRRHISSPLQATFAARRAAAGLGPRVEEEEEEEDDEMDVDAATK